MTPVLEEVLTTIEDIEMLSPEDIQEALAEALAEAGLADAGTN
jgi:hypothetical protein